jgi:uncharacterized membrane protein
MTFNTLIETVGEFGDLLGVAIIASGMLWGGARFLWSVVRGQAAAAYATYRVHLIRTLLLGLEVLVAADVIRTVAVSPTLNSVSVLAAIVAIRTFLSWSLILEMEGKWPWQRGTDKLQIKSKEDV